MDVLAAVLSPQSHCSPRNSPRCSPARRSPRSPRHRTLLFSPLAALSSPVQIDSPEPASRLPRAVLFPPDSPELNGAKTTDMRVTQPPATAPVADRRSKRFDLSAWSNALPATVAPAQRSPLFPLQGNLDVEMHPTCDLPRSTSRPFTFSTSKLDEDDDEDSPFRVPSTFRRASSLKQRRVSPEISLVPTSASYGALSQIGPGPQSAPTRLSSSTSGAKLESLSENGAAQVSFARREPVLEQSVFAASPAPANSRTGPTRSRAGSVSRIPIRSSDPGLARARKATSMLDLAAAANANPLASSRKRNANGALVGNGGARLSRLAANSPMVPPSSSSMQSSSPSAHAMRDVMAESDEEEEGEVPPANGAIPRSRSSALPFHARHSEPLPQTNGFATPAACKTARPLATAFATTGLVSKRARANDPTYGGSPNHALPLPFSLKPQAKEMPLTPCKRPSLLEVAPAPASASPLSPQSGIPRPLLRTASSSSSGSANETSPTAAKAAALAQRRALPLMRRRSSGSLHDEPQTPTRTGESPFSEKQLAATPTSRISPDGKVWPPVPTVIVAGRSSAPTPLTPFNPRASHPPHRPSYRARHSNSALLTLRQRELSTPDRFEAHFSVVRELGKGESSEAFAVKDREDGTVWAVKRTKLAYGGPKDRSRKLEEVDALRALAGGPHIVAFADAWEQGGHLFIQTELCDGGNLAYFLDLYGREHERLPETCVWKILAEVAAGLAHIHAHGFLHLDLKPANIFLTSDGSCRIGDFGLATRWPRQSALEVMRNAGLEHPGWDATVWEEPPVPTERRHRMRSAPEPMLLTGLEMEREGDREYIAPEVLSGVYGREADIFSLGLIALEAATNVVLPDNGESWRKLRSGDLSDVELSSLSEAIVSLLLAMLQPMPEDRCTASGVADHPLVSSARQLADGRPAIVVEHSDFFERMLALATSPVSSDPDAMDVDA